MSDRAPTRVVPQVVVSLLLITLAVWAIRLVGESKLLAEREVFEEETGSLSLADYALPGVEDDRNAAYWLRAGAEALQLTEGSADLLGRALKDDPGSWSIGDLEALRALVKANQPALDQLARSVGLESSTFDFAYEDGFSAVTPPMLDLYRAGRLVAVDLRLGLIEGDRGRLAENLAILDQLSRALGRESFLISALIHLGVERLFLGAIRDGLQEDLLDPELLSDLGRRLEDRDSVDVLRRGVAAEAAAVLAATELRGSPMDSTDPWSRLKWWFVEPFQLTSLLESYSGIAASLDRPWIEIVERARSEAGQVGWGIHEILLPNLLDGVDKLKAVELGQQLARQALRSAREGLEEGELPRDLPDSAVDPYAAGSIRWSIGADGGGDLSAPEAIDLWSAEHVGSANRAQPVFRWRVPPP